MADSNATGDAKAAPTAETPTPRTPPAAIPTTTENTTSTRTTSPQVERRTFNNGKTIEVRVAILPPEKVDATALGLADIWELIAQVRELARKFQDGEITRDEVGDGVKLVLALFGLKEEGELADKFIEQTVSLRAAVRDENGSEIALRRLLADRFLPAGTEDFRLLAVPEGGPEDKREPTSKPLPDHVALSRIASEIEAHCSGNFVATAEAKKPVWYDPTFLPPIVWQIGGTLLFRMIGRLLRDRIAP
jgi:hypothetical protein